MQGRSEVISVTSSQRREVGEEKQIIIENTHEAIIEIETFDKVQDLLRRRTKSGTAPQKNLFTNILYCEDCKKGMWYKKNQKGYRCGGNLRHGHVFCTNKTIVREKDLEQIIMDDLKPLYETLKNEKFISSLLKKLETKKHQFQKDLEQIQTEIDDIKQKKLKYLDLYTENVISNEELVEARELTDKKINELQLKKDQLKQLLNECENENYGIHVSEKLKDLISLKELTSPVLHSLVKRITCTHDGTIHIQYAFVNPLQSA